MFRTSYVHHQEDYIVHAALCGIVRNLLRQLDIFNQKILKVKILSACFFYNEPLSGQKRNTVPVHSVIVHSV